MLHIYEALLSHVENLAQLQGARPAIERVGGKLRIAPPTASGMVLVTLLLPPSMTPQDVLPGLPFYPV